MTEAKDKKDRRRLGDASPSVKYKSGDELLIMQDAGVVAYVKITGVIRDHSIMVTNIKGDGLWQERREEYLGKTGKITFVGREVRYTDFLTDDLLGDMRMTNRRKIYRNVTIGQPRA